MSIERYIHPRIYAAWHPDEKIRMSSSSGGAFTLLAESVIQRGGVVFGAAWNDKCQVVMMGIEKRDGLGLLRESKYVASIPGDEYKLASEFLNEGREVLFSGTPCQIAGLYAFLKEKEYNNLTTVDFICHGTPDRRVWEKYLAYLEDRYDDKIKDVHFRDKRWGVECNLLLVVGLKRRGEKKVIFGKDNTYYCGFNKRLTMRKCCIKCRFNRLPRRADFSLADFRGLGERTNFPFEADKIKGFTGVLVNSSHASRFLEKMELSTWYERPFDELLIQQPHLDRDLPVPKEEYDAFWRDFDVLTWEQLSLKYLTPSLRYRISIFMRRLLGPYLFMRIGAIYKWYRGKRRSPWIYKGGA